eukprot:4250158-Alexandrium_andersonii.AAC.1
MVSPRVVDMSVQRAPTCTGRAPDQQVRPTNSNNPYGFRTALRTGEVPRRSSWAGAKVECPGGPVGSAPSRGCLSAAA